MPTADEQHATSRLAQERAPEQLSPAPEKHRGPAVLRRGQVQPSTTDQRLLDTRGPSDWVHTDPWRVLRIQAEFVEGFGQLAELGSAVAVFGSARTTADEPAYAQGFVVLPGGLGTLDELFEALTLVQTRKVTSFPIVLLGAAFWGPMIEWIKGTLVAEGMVSAKDLDLIQVVDTPEEAVNLVLHGHVRPPSTNGDQRPE
jgi:hypothetical protein